MKVVVKEIDWGMCKDEDEGRNIYVGIKGGNIYVGIEDGFCQNVETGEIYKIMEKDEKGYVEIES